MRVSMNTEWGANNTEKKQSKAVILRKDLVQNRELYLMILPILVFFIIFSYKPMYGALIAFKDYSPGVGFLDSPWVGFKHFKTFISSPDFFRVIKNTLTISFASLVFGFPAPIVFALMLNEIRQEWFKKITQTLTYLPHFISIVVICGLLRDFVSRRGIVTQMLTMLFGIEGNLLQKSGYFVPIEVISGIWQGLGWNSIIYIAALTGIDTQLYEAAEIDGAGKWRQVLSITLPGIVPTVIIMLILRIGGLLNVGYEKIILLYNPLIYETSDVISTYVYRVGIEGQQWSYSTAIGLFNSVINFILVIGANYVSRMTTEQSLW